MWPKTAWSDTTCSNGSDSGRTKGNIPRCFPVTASFGTGVELLPVEITPDEQKEPMTALAPSLSTLSQNTIRTSSCKVEFRHGNMTLENPSPELLTVLIRKLIRRSR
ncbi:IS66 family insertion sequence hypothetical protein [Salmonella enterica subsp. enterica]|nr:IS66 family insertion sequence hypothetical protein [Salmonella enterica subsp. enterica serovar Braenderup]